jgi:two-component system sensor histidine kinase DesK
MSLLYAGRHAPFHPHTSGALVGILAGALVMLRRTTDTRHEEPETVWDGTPHPGRTVQPEQGRGVHATWTFTLGSIVFVVVALAAALVLMTASAFAVSRNPLMGALLVALLASAAVQVRYCWFLQRGRAGGLPRLAWNVALLAPSLVTWVLGLLAPGLGIISAFPLWMSLCLMACLVPKRPRRLLLAGGLVAVAVHPYLAGLSGRAPSAIPTGTGSWLLVTYGAMFPLMLLSALWWWEIVVELDRHRRASAELAVAHERLRFASDLHDIQGHHLQVIALKSELAERMLDLDIEAARRNIHETRIIAKQALEETRLLVSGYREIALDDEIANAREVLSAAGAECELDLDMTGLSGGSVSPGVSGALGASEPSADVLRALGLAVREATTNILRHSTASQASIRLRVGSDVCTVQISNNGLVPDEPSSRTPGSGLAGLRERVALLGGEFETSMDVESDRFTLSLQLPTRQGIKA